MSEHKSEYAIENIEQINMESSNQSIKEWLMTDNMLYRDFFKEVTREEEFMIIQDAISDLICEN